MKRTKYKNYTEYTCSCGAPAAPQSKSAMRKDGSLGPRVSTLTGLPVCAQCLNNDIAKKSGKAETYSEMQEKNAIAKGYKSLLHMINSNTYRGKKYEIPYCQNKDGRLGFECGMKESYFDGSEESIKTLEVDHIDGNANNNKDSNLMVLCPTCHKRKGWKNGDSKSPGRKTLGITKPGLRTFD